MITKLIKEQISDKVAKYIDIENTEHILNALEWHWINGNKPMSTPYWSDKVGHNVLDKFIFGLASENWIISKANARAKWGEFSLNQAKIDTFITAEEQYEYRIKARKAKYTMRNVKMDKVNLVKTPSGIKDMGLVRKGFAKSYNLEFRLDTSYLAKYYDAVLANMVKSMDNIIKKYPSVGLDKTSYSVINQELLDEYIANPDRLYNLEGNVSDSRGRAIANGIKRVGNPISNKDFRACLIVPNGKWITANDDKALKEIYLFVAELIGGKTTSWRTKTLKGMVAISKKELHTLDLATEEGRKELHENIWLERIYAKIAELKENGKVYWDIPMEVDATMSLAQVIGVLTNDQRLLDRTNVINPDTLLDAWHVEGVPRLHTKTVGTPTFYGSAQTARRLLKSKGLECTNEQIKILNKEFNKGAFGVIKAFKNFLIQHSDVKTPTFEMKIWNDTFKVDVNKFRPVGAVTKAYSAWDSEKQRQVVFLNHDVERVPDYDRFRLYFPTGLVHNLDSQTANNTTLELINKFKEWVIPIHDAFLVLPGGNVREIYVKQLEELRINRTSIIETYRKSIGATSKASDIAWAKLHQLIVPDEHSKFAESALK